MARVECAVTSQFELRGAPPWPFHKKYSFRICWNRSICICIFITPICCLSSLVLTNIRPVFYYGFFVRGVTWPCVSWPDLTKPILTWSDITCARMVVMTPLSRRVGGMGWAKRPPLTRKLKEGQEYVQKRKNKLIRVKSELLRSFFQGKYI